MSTSERLLEAVRAVSEAERLTDEVGRGLFGWQGREALVALVQLRGALARLRSLANIRAEKPKGTP